MKSKAQTGVEYLLIIGGAVLIAAVVLFILTQTTDVGSSAAEGGFNSFMDRLGGISVGVCGNLRCESAMYETEYTCPIDCDPLELLPLEFLNYSSCDSTTKVCNYGYVGNYDNRIKWKKENAGDEISYYYYALWAENFTYNPAAEPIPNTDLPVNFGGDGDDETIAKGYISDDYWDPYPAGMKDGSYYFGIFYMPPLDDPDDDVERQLKYRFAMVSLTRDITPNIIAQDKTIINWSPIQNISGGGYWIKFRTYSGPAATFELFTIDTQFNLENSNPYSNYDFCADMFDNNDERWEYTVYSCRRPGAGACNGESGTNCCIDNPVWTTPINTTGNELSEGDETKYKKFSRTGNAEAGEC